MPITASLDSPHGLIRAVMAAILLLVLLAAGPAAATDRRQGRGFVAATKEADILPFMYLGAKHMVTGYDHLLFLLGVIFFLYRMRDVAIYVTLFSIGHSITLLAGVLMEIDVSAYLVDAIIGLSVVYKAFDNLSGFKTLFGVAAEQQDRGGGLRPDPRLRARDQAAGAQLRRRPGREHGVVQYRRRARPDLALPHPGRDDHGLADAKGLRRMPSAANAWFSWPAGSVLAGEQLGGHCLVGDRPDVRRAKTTGDPADRHRPAQGLGQDARAHRGRRPRVGALITLGAICRPSTTRIRWVSANLRACRVVGAVGIWWTWRPPAPAWIPRTRSRRPFARTDTFEIPLAAAGDEPEGTLWSTRCALKPGRTLIYRWEALSAWRLTVTVPVEFDFHGHTVAAEAKGDDRSLN